jgi:spore germination protein
VLGFATRQIPPDKLLLGLAFYGYDWNATSGGARSLGYPEALALAERYAVNVGFDTAAQSATFSYAGLAGDRTDFGPPLARLAHHVTTREPPPCDVAVPPPSPAPTRPPMPRANTPQVHEVWVEDSASAAAWLVMSSRYGVRGIASWRLGLEDERVWPAFEAWRTP